MEQLIDPKNENSMANPSHNGVYCNHLGRAP